MGVLISEAEGWIKYYQKDGRSFAQLRTEPYEYSKRIVQKKEAPVWTIQQENKI